MVFIGVDAHLFYLLQRDCKFCEFFAHISSRLLEVNP